MTPGDAVVLVPAFMAGASGLVHLSVAPAHFAEWWLFGGLFVVVAVLQLGLGVLLIRDPSLRLVAAVVAVNLGLVVAWLLSRTTGLPFGPDAGAPEAASYVDVVTTIDEALLAGLLLAGSRGSAGCGARRRALLGVGQAFGAVLGVVLTVAFAGGVGHA